MSFVSAINIICYNEEMKGDKLGPIDNLMIPSKLLIAESVYTSKITGELRIQILPQ